MTIINLIYATNERNCLTEENVKGFLKTEFH